MVDYVIMNQDGYRSISSCSVIPLNTSGHLPVSCSLDISHLIEIRTSHHFLTCSLDWAKAGGDVVLQSN